MGDFQTFQTAWCPGCGNFGILQSLKSTLEELGKDPYEVLLVGGIGQAAKTPQYLSGNSFCGLHGRSLPAAVAAKIANEKLTVIVNTGDGDSYGEGGNHFLHNIRRNVDITHFIHDNQIYGLTKGQASPTTAQGQVTSVQVTGSINTPMNPLMVAIAAGAGFVARAFSGDMVHLKQIMKEAINYKGYAMVDILQPCTSYNKVNTFSFYRERVYHLEAGYDPTNQLEAMKRAMEFDEKIPIGVIYRKDQDDYHKRNAILNQNAPLLDQETDMNVINNIIHEFV